MFHTKIGLSIKLPYEISSTVKLLLRYHISVLNNTGDILLNYGSSSYDVPTGGKDWKTTTEFPFSQKSLNRDVWMGMHWSFPVKSNLFSVPSLKK